MLYLFYISGLHSWGRMVLLSPLSHLGNNTAVAVMINCESIYFHNFCQVTIPFLPSEAIVVLGSSDHTSHSPKNRKAYSIANISISDVATLKHSYMSSALVTFRRASRLRSEGKEMLKKRTVHIVPIGYQQQYQNLLTYEAW